MASIGTEKNGNRRVMVEMPDTKRYTIRLGKVSLKDARAVCNHIERLANSVRANTPAPSDTIEWLSGIGDVLRSRMAKAGLCTPPAERVVVPAGEDHPHSVRAVFKAYFDRRTDLKKGSKTAMRQAQNKIVAHFTPGRIFNTIAFIDAKDFRQSITSKYAEATVAKTIKVARQVWADAAERGIAKENVFQKVRTGSMENKSRLRFIRRDVIDRVIEAAPDTQWKLIIALCRYGGLRCPSEHLMLRWDEINWEEKKMLVHAPKNERHANKRIRWVPIFPEVAPFLQKAFDEAEDGERYVITRYRSPSVNIRTMFERIITRAGETPWVKLFQNLRASRETELLRTHPIHVVCDWIGNDELTAKKHYLQVTQEDFDAAQISVDKKAAHFPAQQVAAIGGNAWQENRATADITPKTPVSGVIPDSQVTPRGFEPLSRP